MSIFFVSERVILKKHQFQTIACGGGVCGVRLAGLTSLTSMLRLSEVVVVVVLVRRTLGSDIR